MKIVPSKRYFKEFKHEDLCNFERLFEELFKYVRKSVFRTETISLFKKMFLSNKIVPSKNHFEQSIRMAVSSNLKSLVFRRAISKKLILRLSKTVPTTTVIGGYWEFVYFLLNKMC